MGAKRKSVTRQNSNANYTNVVDIKPFQKPKKQVNILPRNKNQETYLIYYYSHMVLIIYSLDKLKFWTKMSTKPKNALSMLKNDIKKKLKFITNA